MLYLLKILLLGFSSFGSSAPTSPPSFEGIIKYKSINIEKGITDTIICYYGNNKIKEDRIGRLARDYGAYSNTYRDFQKFPNTNFLWSEERKELSTFKNTGKGIKEITPIPDSSKIVLNYKCHLKRVEYNSSFFMENQFDTVEEIWFAEDLIFEIKSGCDAGLSILSNGINHIPLYTTRMVYNDVPYISSSPNIRVAYEIIPMKLDDKIFEIPTK